MSKAQPHCIPIFSQVFEERRMYDQGLTCYIEIHSDDTTYFPLHMELALTAGCIFTLG